MRTERSGPEGPSRLNYRDVEDRLEVSNFTVERKEKKKDNLKLDGREDSLFVMCFGNSVEGREKRGEKGGKKETETQFASDTLYT